MNTPPPKLLRPLQRPSEPALGSLPSRGHQSPDLGSPPLCLPGRSRGQKGAVKRVDHDGKGFDNTNIQKIDNPQFCCAAPTQSVSRIGFHFHGSEHDTLERHHTYLSWAAMRPSF